MLLEAMIAQMCIGLVGNQLEACHKAFQAAGLQSGISRSVDKVEHDTTEVAYRKVEAVTGETPLVTTTVAYKAVRDRSLTFSIRKNSNGMLPSIAPTISVGSGALNLGWKF